MTSRFREAFTKQKQKAFKLHWFHKIVCDDLELLNSHGTVKDSFSDLECQCS